MNSAQKLYMSCREYFTSERSKQEILVAQWAAKLQQADPKVLEELGISPNITLKSLMPELYEDEPNPAIYDSQYESANALFAKVNAYVDKYNAEALKALEQYKASIAEV